MKIDKEKRAKWAALSMDQQNVVFDRVFDMAARVIDKLSSILGVEIPFVLLAEGDKGIMTLSNCEDEQSNSIISRASNGSDTPPIEIEDVNKPENAGDDYERIVKIITESVPVCVKAIDYYREKIGGEADACMIVHIDSGRSTVIGNGSNIQRSFGYCAEVLRAVGWTCTPPESGRFAETRDQAPSVH